MQWYLSLPSFFVMILLFLLSILSFQPAFFLLLEQNLISSYSSYPRFLFIPLSYNDSPRCYLENLLSLPFPSSFFWSVHYKLNLSFWKSRVKLSKWVKLVGFYQIGSFVCASAGLHFWKEFWKKKSIFLSKISFQNSFISFRTSTWDFIEFWEWASGGAPKRIEWSDRQSLEKIEKIQKIDDFRWKVRHLGGRVDNLLL